MSKLSRFACVGKSAIWRLIAKYRTSLGAVFSPMKGQVHDGYFTYAAMSVSSLPGKYWNSHSIYDEDEFQKECQEAGLELPSDATTYFALATEAQAQRRYQDALTYYARLTDIEFEDGQHLNALENTETGSWNMYKLCESTGLDEYARLYRNRFNTLESE